MILSSYIINGKVVGTELSTWNENDLNGNPAFKTESSLSSGYANISSITNWDLFGLLSGVDILQVRNEIITLSSSFSSLSDNEKQISVRYLAVSKSNRDSIYTPSEQKQFVTDIQLSILSRKKISSIHTNADNYINDSGIPSINRKDITGMELLFFTPAITPVQLTSNLDNYNPTGLSSSMRLRLTSDGLRAITGIDATNMYDGKLLLIENINSVANSIKLVDNSASSIASNRFYLNGDKTIGKNESCLLTYDGILYRWRISARSN